MERGGPEKRPKSVLVFVLEIVSLPFTARKAPQYHPPELPAVRNARRTASSVAPLWFGRGGGEGKWAAGGGEERRGERRFGGEEE
jgi:hypothetical protein